MLRHETRFMNLQPKIPLFVSGFGPRAMGLAGEYGDGLVFGRETVGLPDDLLAAHATQLVRIPMLGDHHRSLNQAQAAAIGLYEALRQTENW